MNLKFAANSYLILVRNFFVRNKRNGFTLHFTNDIRYSKCIFVSKILNV